MHSQTLVIGVFSEMCTVARLPGLADMHLARHVAMWPPVTLAAHASLSCAGVAAVIVPDQPTPCLHFGA